VTSSLMLRKAYEAKLGHSKDTRHQLAVVATSERPLVDRISRLKSQMKKVEKLLILRRRQRKTLRREMVVAMRQLRTQKDEAQKKYVAVKAKLQRKIPMYQQQHNATQAEQQMLRFVRDMAVHRRRARLERDEKRQLEALKAHKYVEARTKVDARRRHRLRLKHSKSDSCLILISTRRSS